MSVTIEEQKKGDEKNEVKRIIRIMVRKVYETYD
ncbi:unknown [Firmicutes bacterium CAG:449]|nr:unknown [Firmicutes bacterium CAG:449]